MNIKKGDRYTNHLGLFCIVKSVYGSVIKLQVISDETYTEVWDRNDFNKCKTFIKIPIPKIDRTNISKYLLEYQLNMIGKTLHEAKNTPNWFKTWEITKRQQKSFEEYAIPLLKKTFKVNKLKSLEIYEWFNLQFGLKIKKHS